MFEIASKLKWYAELLQFSEEKNEDAKDYVDTVKEGRQHHEDYH